MKKNYFTIVLVLFIGTLFAQTTFVPDNKFEYYLELHDADRNHVSMGDPSSLGDGILNNSVPTWKISNLTELDVYGLGILDLTGIEDFKSLIYLNCENNPLTNLNISSNTLLKRLYVDNCNLTSLDISNNIKLTNLSCGNNNLTSLDISNNIYLRDFYCADNDLTSLDISKNINLDDFDCSDNYLVTLDISNNINLIDFVCRNNYLTSLNLSSNSALKYFDCSNNNLSCLNLQNGNNAAIIETESYDNGISTIGNPNLNCIQVDDATWSAANWNTESFAFDAYVTFSEFCNKENLKVFNLNSSNQESELDIEDLSIASDGSSATLFKYIGEDFENVKFKIKEELISNPDFYGIFQTENIVGSTLEIKYSHPTYFSSPTPNFPNPQHKKITIQVVNKLTNSVCLEFPVKIVRPSVLMVHGIWSNGEDAFGGMERYLLNQEMYKNFQIEKVEYLKGDKFNWENLRDYIRSKKALFGSARRQNVSMGKFDVLGHSNGAVLSRHYIQSNEYKNDINKLISFNAPNSGSQLPNLLLDPDFFFLHPLLEKFDMNSTNGVISDLKVDGDYIRNLNKPKNREGKYSNIALHTVTSTETVDNLVGSWDALIVYYLKFHWEEAIDYALENFVFYSPFHDIIVPLSSQIAGCSATTPFTGQWHSGSTSNPIFWNRAKELLNQNPNNASYFSKNGYNPTTLVSNFNSTGSKIKSHKQSLETISIVSPIAGTEYNAGDNVAIDVTGSVGIENIVSSMGSALTPLQNHISEGVSSDNFNFTIPNNAIGRLEIVSAGFDAGGYADYDSTYINVVTTATLDSLTISQSLIYVPEGHNAPISIFGHYDDGETRNITYVTDLVYAFDNDYAIVPESGLVSGLFEGEDILKVSYLGKMVSVPVTIANSSEWVELPLTIESKVFLQGPYDTNTGLMKDDLRSNGLIPLTSPYSDTKEAIGSVFNLGGDSGSGLPEDDIVDWLWIELRDKTDGTTVIGSSSALLQRDGDVVDVDGVSLLEIEATADEYYLMISHRNHLGVLSVSTLSFASGYSKIDPSVDSTIVTGGTNAIRDMGNGYFALYSGDFNGDGQVQNIDKNAVEPLRGLSGYNNADIDMNGQVQNTDINNILNPNLGKGEQYTSRKLNAKRNTSTKQD